MTTRRFWLAAACLLFLLLCCYQLELPGIHYDEAREAGVNAVELLKGASVTSFRDAALTLFGRQFPLMVQDYIGALNVYLALPILWLTGIGVPNLRALSVLTGLAVLPLAAYTVSAWQTLHIAGRREESRSKETSQEGGSSPRTDLSRKEQVQSPRSDASTHLVDKLGKRDDSRRDYLTWGGVAAAWLLAASPSFIFWSRQGIFVTNLTEPLCLLALWQGTRWLATGRRRSLWWAMLAAGLALYAKLLAVWVIGPWLLLLALQWLWIWRKGESPPLDGVTALVAFALLLLPLTPLLLFNLQTGGTLQALLGHAGQSYYGVNNLAIWRNGGVRLAEWVQSLRGDQFWYLGGLYGNPAAPWLAAAGIALGLVAAWRRILAPLAILLLAVAASCFTISDLFVTHYALIQPVTVVVVALGLGLAGERWPRLRRTLVVVVVTWAMLDVQATLFYHQALARSGGLADHSDASYHLAYYLRYNGLGAPVALDWGMDAPVRFLSENTVKPIEIFGYSSPIAPDKGFVGRLDHFLSNPDNVYLLHAPSQTVFVGRREAFLAEVAVHGQKAMLEATFSQRDGTPLYELWRVTNNEPGNDLNHHVDIVIDAAR